MADDDPDSAPAGQGDDAREGARKKRTAARRQLLGLQPGSIRDLDAAASWECSVHPRPGQPDRHGGGLCPCQWTETDRAAHLAEFNRVIEQQSPEQEALQRENMQALAAAAAEPEIEAFEEVPGAPWAITGRVDGRRYYLRDRWDTNTVVVSPADQPDLNPWRGPGSARLIVVRSGDSADLFTGRWVNYRRALREFASAVRTQMRREACEHPHDDADRFCPACGWPSRTWRTGSPATALEGWLSRASTVGSGGDLDICVIGGGLPIQAAEHGAVPDDVLLISELDERDDLDARPSVTIRDVTQGAHRHPDAAGDTRQAVGQRDPGLACLRPEERSELGDVQNCPRRSGHGGTGRPGAVSEVVAGPCSSPLEVLFLRRVHAGHGTHGLRNPLSRHCQIE